MHRSRPTVELGSFVVGEVPTPLVYRFLDADGQPINLTGFGVATFQWSEVVRGQYLLPVVEVAVVTNAVDGQVTYTWDGDEFDAPGEYAALFYVNDGTNQYASDELRWQVCLSIGTPPVV